jgi:purple acid phosphatase-like protein
MNRLLLKLAVAGTVSSLLFSNSSGAQFHGPQTQTPPPEILPPQKRADHVEITKVPELELANSWMAIVRWTTTNPRGLDEHYGVVHYGTDPEDMSQTAKGHIRLNRAHPETIFRVRLQGLQPQTTYYYKVTSEDSAGKSDGVEGSVSHFTTPPPGEVINNYPQPKS